VSEVKDWILPALVLYMAEIEQNLQQMMESLLARQTEEMNAKAKVSQDKANAVRISSKTT
jgi:hypothetical protein